MHSKSFVLLCVVRFQFESALATNSVAMKFSLASSTKTTAQNLKKGNESVSGQRNSEATVAAISVVRLGWSACN